MTMSSLVFRSRALVAFSVSRSLSEVHVEKSGTASTSRGNGKKVEGYVSVVKKVWCTRGWLKNVLNVTF